MAASAGTTQPHPLPWTSPFLPSSLPLSPPPHKHTHSPLSPSYILDCMPQITRDVNRLVESSHGRKALKPELARFNTARGTAWGEPVCITRGVVCMTSGRKRERKNESKRMRGIPGWWGGVLPTHSSAARHLHPLHHLLQGDNFFKLTELKHVLDQDHDGFADEVVDENGDGM